MVDYHWDQLVFGLGYHFFSFEPQKRQKELIFGSENSFFAFFEAKMTKNDIPNPKLIDPNDNQPFYIRILRFF